MNKHQQKTEETQKKLLKAARQIFVRDGFEAARIDDITKLAGFTRGAFYAHFQAKEELFFALLEQQASAKCGRMLEALKDCHTDADRLKAMEEIYLSSLQDPQWAILTMEFKLYALRHPRMRARLAEAHRRIRQDLYMAQLAPWLPGWMTMGSPRGDSIRIGLEALLSGLALQSRYDPDSVSPEKARQVLSACFQALVSEDNTI